MPELKHLITSSQGLSSCRFHSDKVSHLIHFSMTVCHPIPSPSEGLSSCRFHSDKVCYLNHFSMTKSAIPSLHLQKVCHLIPFIMTRFHSFWQGSAFHLLTLIRSVIIPGSKLKQQLDTLSNVNQRKSRRTVQTSSKQKKQNSKSKSSINETRHGNLGEKRAKRTTTTKIKEHDFFF